MVSSMTKATMQSKWRSGMPLTHMRYHRSGATWWRWVCGASSGKFEIFLLALAPAWLGLVVDGMFAVLQFHRISIIPSDRQHLLADGINIWELDNCPILSQLFHLRLVVFPGIPGPGLPPTRHSLQCLQLSNAPDQTITIHLIFQTYFLVGNLHQLILLNVFWQGRPCCTLGGSIIVTATIIRTGINASGVLWITNSPLSTQPN